MSVSSLGKLCAFLALAGCSGGSSGGGNLDDPGGTQTPPITGRQDLPQSGVANYLGFMTLNLPVNGSRGEAVGDLSLAVDFGAAQGQVTGTADGFVLLGDSLTGRIFVTAGQIIAETSTDPAGFEADLSGSLKGGALPNTLLTGTIDADFETTDGSVISGTAFGDLTTTSGIDVFDGTFSAVRP